MLVRVKGIGPYEYFQIAHIRREGKGVKQSVAETQSARWPPAPVRRQAGGFPDRASPADGLRLGPPRDGPARRASRPFGLRRPCAAADQGPRREGAVRPPPENAEGDILVRPARNPTRRERPRRMGMDQHRDHHPRLERAVAAPVAGVGTVERREVHLPHHVPDQVRQAALGQMVAHVDRQQHELVVAALAEARRHRFRPLEAVRGRNHKPGHARILLEQRRRKNPSMKVTSCGAGS